MEASLAFYRALGVEIPEANVWRTETGAHHVNADTQDRNHAIHLDLDSTKFAAAWYGGWAGRSDLRGRVYVGFRLPSRTEVDALHEKMTAAGHPSLQKPTDGFWGARYAIIENPDGVAVGLMSESSDDMKSPPPEV